MKTQLTNLFNQIIKTKTETISAKLSPVAVMNNGQSKIFSSAELWNIQRQRKTATPRRRFAY